MLKAALNKLPPFLSGPIARGASIAVILRCLNVAMGFVITLLLARIMGVEGFGVFAYGAGLALLIALPARLGFQQFLVKTLPDFESKKDWPSFTGASTFSLTTSLAISLICTFIAVIAISMSMEPGPMQRVSYIGAAIAPIVSLSSLGQAFLRARMKILHAYAPEFIVVQAVFLCLISAIIMANRATPENVLIGFGIAWIASTVASGFFTIRAWPAEASVNVREIKWRAWLPLIPAMTVAGLFMMLLGRIEPVALAAFSEPAQIGLYAVALRFCLLATFPSFAVSSGLSPILAQLHAQNDTIGIQRRLTLSARAGILGTFGACFAVAAIVWIILPRLGTGFTEAHMTIVVLLLGFVAQTMGGRGAEALIMLGHVRAAMTANLIATIAFILLLFIFTPSHGALGAGLATAIALAIYALLLAVMVKLKTGYRSDIFAPLTTRETPCVNNPQHRAAE